MLKKQHFDEDSRIAEEIILDPNRTLEEKLLWLLHEVKMVGKIGFDARQNQVAIMKALNIPMIADRQQVKDDNE